jgi:hypothetical protein
VGPCALGSNYSSAQSITHRTGYSSRGWGINEWQVIANRLISLRLVSNLQSMQVHPLAILLIMPSADRSSRAVSPSNSLLSSHYLSNLTGISYRRLVSQFCRNPKTALMPLCCKAQRVCRNKPKAVIVGQLVHSIAWDVKLGIQLGPRRVVLYQLFAPMQLPFLTGK